MIAKTNNRSVLGSMNDLCLQVKGIVYSIGGLADADLSGINRQVNVIPMSAIKYNIGVEALKRRLFELESATNTEF